MSTACRIRVLSDLLIKKIAAGEVVERPASVVKELVENAIDAGARRIAVTIEDGGKQLIRVTDEGDGMLPEELRLAVTPHATSKIAVEDDLYAVATMGFRGEALASISSVSKLRIVSRRAAEVEGHEIRVTGQQVESSQAAGCPGGTTVEVRDLFFNVPVRRKFLRANSTETGHISEQLARVALVNPEIAFEFTANGRIKQNLPACESQVERIAKWFSPDLASALLHTQRDERGVHLEVYVAPPAQSRATAQWQYTFVNGRYIRDRYIQHAAKEAHRGLTEPNRHGVFFLFLGMDPHSVDVNVHPTKIEVRWADPNLIHSQVLSAIRETFQQADLSPVLRMDRSRQPVDENRQQQVRQEMAALLKATPPFQSTGSSTGSPAPFGGVRVGARSPSDLGPAPADAAQTWRSLYSAPDVPSHALGQTSGAQGPSQRPDASPGPVRPRAIQMHNLYLVAETDDGIVIVDQHALHERILYEQFRDRITAGPLESQRLLLPETMNVTPRQAALLEHNADLVHKLGMELVPFGADAVAVQSFPSLLKDTDVVSFVSDLLDYFGSQESQVTPDAVIDHVLSMMACKAAVKAGDPLAPEEIQALFEKRHLIEKPSSCPHGRPTMLRLTRADLDRQFHRT